MCLKNNMVFILFLAGVLLWGGFYDFSAAVYGCIFNLLLMICFYRKKKIILSREPIFYGGIGLLCCGIISVIVAEDRGMAFTGVLRAAVLAAFWLMWSNMEESSRERVFDAIPQSGTAVNIAAIFAYFIPGLKDIFYSGDRLGGSFQYSNTYALFLLAGILVVLFRLELGRRDWIQVGILLAGIVMTGSRSVFILTIVFAGIVLLRRKAEKKEKLLAAGGTLIGAAIAVGILQAVLKLDIGRLADLSLNSSTLNGRFLYWQDALPVILKHPLGLGYMGYYFLQPQFQTGRYFTMFVHNDLLQWALDMGIAAAVIVAVLVIMSLLDKENPIRNKTLLLLLFVHGLFDFDMQFMMIPCIAIMCFNCRRRNIITIDSNMVSIIAGAAGVTFLYFAVAFGLDYAGCEQLALMMYPGNTIAREGLLASDDQDEAYEAARRIIGDNGMIADAYEATLRYDIEHEAYDQALDDVKRMLQCAGYDTYYYNQAVYQLSFALDATVRSGDMEMAQAVLKVIQGIPDELETLKERTTSLAYRIYDQPVFTLDEEIENYVSKLEGVNLIEE